MSIHSESTTLLDYFLSNFRRTLQNYNFKMTSHTNVQDLRKQETRTAQQHNGTIPKDSEVSALKVSYTYNSDT